jgi:opacity protein-like surface antigen
MDRVKVRKSALLGGSALMLVLSGSSGALAQNCTSTPLRGGFLELGGLAASVSSSVAASIGNVNTAFLAQQGSAFVANPGGAAPGQQGGGVWARGVGGEVDIDTTSVTLANQSPVLNPAIDQGTINCASRVREQFAGVQVGVDLARLNMAGWNVNLGTTAGYLESRADERNGGAFRTNFEVPFAGVYGVATFGGFFADVMVRSEFYNMSLINPGLNLHNQPVDARGLSVSASAGYNMPVGAWFIEPSLGFIWSRTKVDAFNSVGLPIPGLRLSGTFSINDIDSEIGRATVRIGTSFTTGNLALQPFVSASVFHEFANDVTSRYVTCPSCVFVGDVPVTATFDTTSTRVGTWGQFSLGVAGQVLNTGWVGFVRGDYRVGDNIEGWTANGGLRYNFVPAAVAAPIITKGPAVPPPVTAVNWTGFYVGGFFGGDFGTSRISIDGTSARPKIAGYLAGGQAGYNYQLGPYVIGVEADIGATNKTGARPCGSATGLTPDGINVGTFSPFFLTCSNDLDWVATLTGRLGMTWERALFYVKGGGAWTRENVTIGCILGPTNPAISVGGTAIVRGCFNPAGVLTNGIAVSDDRFGGVIGFGTEFALTSNWSAKAEYNFIDFGKDTLRAADGTLLTSNTRINEVKVGLSYHFSPMSPF